MLGFRANQLSSSSFYTKQSPSVLSKSAMDTTFQARLKEKPMMPHSLGKFKPRGQRPSKMNLYERATDMLSKKQLPLSKDGAEAAFALKQMERHKQSVISLQSDASEHKIGLSQTVLNRAPSGSVTKIMSIKDATQRSPSYTVITQHDNVVSLNHLSEAPLLPIAESQLTYHKRNYLVANPSRNEVLLAKKTQNLESKKLYALHAAYVDTRSPIFSKESLAFNTLSPMNTAKMKPDGYISMQHTHTTQSPVTKSGHSQIFDGKRAFEAYRSSVPSPDHARA